MIDQKVSNLKTLVFETNNKIFVVVGENPDCEKAVQMVKDLFCKDHVELNDYHSKFVKGSKWQDILSALEKYNFLIRKTERDKIILIGIKQEVREAKLNLEEQLKTNSYRQEVFEVKKGICRFMKQHCGNELYSIMDRSGARVETVTKSGKWFVEVSGTAESVDVALKQTKALVGTFCYGTLSCGKPGLAPYFLDESKTIGRRLVQSLELETECAIEIRAGPRDTTGATARLESPPLDINTVTVKHGNITDAKAGVLVNSVADESSNLLKCGAIAKAFAEAGGDGLCKEFTQLGGLKCGMVGSTMHDGKLQCQLVLHASIRRWRGSETRKLLKDTIAECLKIAQQYGLKSITFPTLGCGNLHYPVDEVANCFKEAASRAKGIKISLVAFDKKIYSELKYCLATKSVPRKRDYSVRAQSVIFHINAETADVLKTVKSKVQDIIDQSYDETQVQDSSIEHMRDSEIVRIYKLSTTLVIVDPNVDGNVIRIFGQKDAVTDVAKEVRKHVHKFSKIMEQPEHVKQLRGKKGYLQMLMKEPDNYPAHWTKNKNLFSKIKVLTSIDPMKSMMVPVDAKTFSAVDKLMTTTWRTNLVGHGADAKGLAHKSLKINKVHRIENQKVYKEYRRGISSACEAGTHRDYTPITSVNNEPEILTAQCNISLLDSLRISEINEYFLFHGIKADTAENIVSQGLDCRMGGSKPGLFGRGIYLAESSTKADQYSDDPKHRNAGKVLYMVVARVILGNIFQQKGAQHFNRPPCMKSGCNQEKCSHSDRFDSVMGTHKDSNVVLNFREFVIYDNKCVYPEFLVEYQRQ